MAALAVLAAAIGFATKNPFIAVAATAGLAAVLATRPRARRIWLRFQGRPQLSDWEHYYQH